MIDKYTLISYKSAIEREKKKIEDQIDWLSKIGLSKEEALRRNVQNYFEHILCTFNEEAYIEALKSL